MFNKMMSRWFKKQAPNNTIKRRMRKPHALTLEQLEKREVLTGVVLVPGSTTSLYGSSLLLTADVTGSASTNGDTVTFYNGSTSLGSGTVSGSNVLGAGGTASYTVPASTLSVGVHSLTAVFGGDLVDSAATSPAVPETINYKPGDLVATQVGFNSPIANVSVSGQTVTVTTSEYLPFALNATVNLTITGNSGSNINGNYAITILSQNSFSFTAVGGTPVAGTSGTVSVGLARRSRRSL